MAAKSGMAKTCWSIAQKNRGECARLINYENKQKQKPYDLIRNEKGYKFKQIRDWIRLEARTNDFLDKNSDTTTIYEKKTDDFLVPSKFPTKKLCSLLPSNNIFKLNSYRQGYIEWLSRLTAFFILLTIPQILNRILFDPDEFTYLRAFLGFGSLAAILFVLTKQKHRINHISGWENPFYLGYFMAVATHNYVSYYSVVVQCNLEAIYYIFQLLKLIFLSLAFNVINVLDLLSVLLTSLHIYSFYVLMTANPGQF